MVTTTELPSLRDIRDRDPYPVYEAYHWRARVATQDVKLAGVTIRAGDRVHPVNAAANRDPNYWPDPTRFDIDRPRLPTHLAFNVGPRHCAGAHLARMEAGETLLALFRDLPHLRPDPDGRTPIFAGYVTRTWRPLDLVFDPPARTVE